MRIVLAVVEAFSLLAACVVGLRYISMGGLLGEKSPEQPEQKVVALAFVVMFSTVAVALGGSSINFPVLVWPLRLVGAVEGAGAIAAAVRKKSFLEQAGRALRAAMFFLLSMF
ncbi:MAG: hypothetical protein ACPLQP_01105 [Moorellaceae bacterium]